MVNWLLNIAQLPCCSMFIHLWPSFVFVVMFGSVAYGLSTSSWTKETKWRIIASLPLQYFYLCINWMIITCWILHLSRIKNTKLKYRIWIKYDQKTSKYKNVNHYSDLIGPREEHCHYLLTHLFQNMDGVGLLTHLIFLLWLINVNLCFLAVLLRICKFVLCETYAK